MSASRTTLAVSVVCRDVHPDSPNTYDITFALWIGVHFPQEGVEELYLQPYHTGKEYTDR